MAPHTDTAANPASEPLHADAVDLGFVLGMAREKSGKSLDELAEITKLRRGYIRAMEAGDFAALPSEPYASSYIRRYAEALKLDAGDITARYIALNEPTPHRLRALPKTFTDHTHASGKLALIGTVASVILLLIFQHDAPHKQVERVMQFADTTTYSKPIISHRCTEALMYPPCNWERMDLWFTTYTDAPPFIVTDENHAATP